MRENPVFQEGLRVYFIEGHVFVAYFYILIFLTSVELLALYLPSLDGPIWMGSATVFKISSVAALLLVVYFTLRTANQEIVHWRFLPLNHWLREKEITVATVVAGQLALFSLFVCSFVLICVPPLVWAGAISQTQPVMVVTTLLLLVFYASSYSVWGLAATALWGQRPETRQVVVRCLLMSLAILSILLYSPLNPIVYLWAYLGEQELIPLAVGNWRLSPIAIHVSFHMLILSTGLIAYGWALQREDTS